MSVSLTLAGIDVSGALTGALIIEANEGCSVVATFALCDDNKQLGHEALIAGAVSVSYSGDALFSGVVREAVFDPFTRTFDIKATDIRSDAAEYPQSWLESSVFDKPSGGTWGMYYEPLNGAASDTLDMAVKSLDCEWAVLEVDKAGAFRVVDCQASVTPDVTLGPDDFLFRAVKLTAHDPSRVKNYVSYDLVESYSLTWTYFYTQEVGPIESGATDVVSMLRSGASAVGQWNLIRPVKESQLGAGPPYTFDVVHKAQWVQQKRKQYPLISFRSLDSIAKFGFQRAAHRRIHLDHDADSESTGYGIGGSYEDGFLQRICKNSRKEPDGFEVENVLAGMARAAMLESHRLFTVSMEVPLYAAVSRTWTIQGNFPNLNFRGKCIKYRHEINIESGRAVTSIDVTVIPPLTC